MASLYKKLTLTLVAVLAAVCLVCGIYLAVPVSASADTTPSVTAEETLQNVSDFEISEDGTLTGLKTNVGNKTYAIVVPANIKVIGDSAFLNDRNLVSVKFTTDSNLTKIGNSAFNGCTRLAELSLPETAEFSISSNAFSRCTSLTTITIPKNVKSIGTQAFSDCTSVDTINYLAINCQPVTASPFTGLDVNKKVKVVIGDSASQITFVPGYLFQNTAINSVTFNNVLLETENAFHNAVFGDCRYLTEVVFRGCTVNVIGNDVFSGCSTLSKIDISGLSSLHTIGDRAFYACSSLYTLTIPENVTRIGLSAFQSCSRLIEVQNLSQLNIVSGLATISNNTDANGNSAPTVNTYLGSSAKNVYGETGTKLSQDTEGFIFYDRGTTDSLLIGYVGPETRLTLPDGSYKIYNRAFFNNLSLEAVTIPRDVTEIHEYAFYGCTALNEVNIASTTNVSTLNAYTFANCTSLESISIPASVSKIDTYAFQNCSKLKTVSFGSDTKLKTVDTGVFLNCTALEVIKLPKSITSFGVDVFKGCTNLKIAYLPEVLTSRSGLFDTNTSDGRLLIVPSAESYGNYTKDNAALWATYGTLTYEIPVYLVYGDYKGENATGEHHIEYKLYGLDYTYEKDGNIWATTGGMPVQNGYSESVWYSDAESIGNASYVIGSSELNDLLSGDVVPAITLFAAYIDYTELEFTLIDTRNYTEDSVSPMGTVSEWKYQDAVLSAERYGDMFSVEIADYSPFSGTANVQSQLKDAGTYTLRVVLTSKYGKWNYDLDEVRNATEKEYVINPQMITFGEGADVEQPSSAYINWGVVGSNIAMSPTNGSSILYIYGNTPYSKVQTNPSLGQVKEVPVSSSYVLYNGKSWTIDLRVADGYLSAITNYYADDNSVLAADGKGITASQPGIYTASARFVVANNYRFKYSKPANDTYGLTITEDKTAEGYVYTVTKVWYIVTADASELIGSDGGIYEVTGWTYGVDNEVPGAPTLSSEITRGMEDELITFTLENELIFNTVVRYNYSQYESVINSSMPVGNYVITIYVADYITEGGDKISGSGTGGYSWDFEVRARDIDRLLVDLKNEGKISGTSDLWGNLYSSNVNNRVPFEVEYKAGKVQFAGDSSTPVLNVPVLKLEESDIHNRQGIWTSPIYNDYYGGFVLKYNVKELTTGTPNYYTAENYTNGPVEPGRYTVYYNVTVNNFTSKIDISTEAQRTQYYYTLYIKEYIDIASINPGTVAFTGRAIRFNDTDIYKFIYLDGSSTDSDTLKAVSVNGGATENYVNAADSVTVALMIRTQVADYYGWKNGQTFVYGSTSAERQEFAKFTFTISRANNSTTTPLYLRDWEWGTDVEFDIQWGTEFGSKDDYTFTLQSVADKTLVYYYNPSSTQLGFDKADAGAYTLIATARGGVGYNWNTYTETRPVYILQSTVTLETNPYIESWKYGDYEELYKTPVYKLSEGFSSLESSVSYYITTLADYNKYLDGTINKEEMTAYPAIENMLDSNGEVPVGSYVYVFELPESGNYAEWSHEVYFSVLQVRNYWETTPTVHDWVYGDYTTRDTTIDCEPHFGNKNSVIYYYRYVGVSGWVTVIPDDWFDKYGELSVGQYEFRAYLQGNDNYDDLESHMFFNVTPAKNSWTEDGIPGVNSWSQGRWNANDNALTATAKYGTVIFQVYSASDTERKNALNINNLNALGVGSYILVATVEGTDDYDTLVGEATFAVFEDSVGMTGIIAATIVFAVIAIGLAVGGVVLLILRNKKIEEEFRKMIKSELRRK